MATGTVRRFDPKRGFGFIQPDDAPEGAADGTGDAFVHQKDIVMEGFRSLFSGEKVEFDAEANEKGIKALNVRLLSPRTERPARAPRAPAARRTERSSGGLTPFDKLIDILLRTEQLTPEEVEEIRGGSRAMAHSDH